MLLTEIKLVNHITAELYYKNTLKTENCQEQIRISELQPERMKIMNITIGQRIKQRRKAMNITGAQIKEKTGISTGNLSEIENGKSLPSATAIIQLSRILECSTDYILLGETRNSESSPYSDIQLGRLVHYYQKMSEQDQKELLMIAEMKANK